jgi:S1-C subfamily serine protease
MKKIFALIMMTLLWSGLTFAQTVSDMLENTIGAVVTVGVYQNELAKHALGFRGEAASSTAYEKALDLSGAMSSGSGFIIDKGGKKYVITNAHVVENASDNPGSIYVFTINRNKYEVKVVGGDSFYDLAVLEFVDQPGTEVTVIRFTQAEPRLGEKVFAIGNPLGEYPYSVSDGIISAKNRVRGGMTGKFGFLQTTATLIWGNSGGPLVNEKGEVVGVNSQIAFADLPDGSTILQQQINFALEADICVKLVNDIIATKGRVVRSYFGIEIKQSYEYLDLGDGTYLTFSDDALPVLNDVFADSPAAGVLSPYIGYSISAINDHKTSSLEEALGELEMTKPGAKVKFSFEKDGIPATVTVTSGQLTPVNLETLAKHVMDKNTEIQMDYTHPQVSFTMGNNTMYYQSQEESQNRQQYRQNHRSGYEPEKYFILAAGVHADEGSNMWLTDDYQNLGAALRLSGLAGSIDYYVLRAGGTEDEIEVVRQYLSGDENIVQSTLWY